MFKYEMICSRGVTIPYDGKSPFDVYPVIVKGTIKDRESFEQLKPGAIVWIQDGQIKTRSRKHGSTTYWNTYLTANIKDLKIISQQPIGPSYSEHLRLSTNDMEAII